jgi:hypothetical protein
LKCKLVREVGLRLPHYARYQQNNYPDPTASARAIFLPR